MSKTLIYGSNGFLAKAFEAELIRRQLAYVKVSRDLLDMTDLDSVKIFVENENFDSVFFGIGPTPCKTQGMYLENINLLLTLLQALSVTNKSPKFTYISSDAVYGVDSIEPRNENTLTAPDTLHGEMHFVRERILQNSNLTLVILRCSAIFGIGDRHGSYGPNRFYRDLMENRDITLFGKGGDKRDHVWIKDFGRVAADLHLKTSGVFNVVSGLSSTFSDIANEMIRLSGRRNRITYQKNTAPESQILYDNSKLVETLGYPISDSLARGLVSYFQEGGEVIVKSEFTL